jgi:hypothetical protein
MSSQTWLDDFALIRNAQLTLFIDSASGIPPASRIYSTLVQSEISVRFAACSAPPNHQNWKTPRFESLTDNVHAHCSISKETGQFYNLNQTVRNSNGFCLFGDNTQVFTHPNDVKTLFGVGAPCMMLRNILYFTLKQQCKFPLLFGMLPVPTGNSRVLEDLAKSKIILKCSVDVPLLLTIVLNLLIVEMYHFVWQSSWVSRWKTSVAFLVAPYSGHNRIGSIACHRTANWDINIISSECR